MKKLIQNLDENKEIVSVIDLNKQFKSGYGIKNINFNVKKGTVYGYLGPNGAGKSTTIRILMGFIKAQSGESNILNTNQENNNFQEILAYDSWMDSNKIQKIIGYVPGEIAFPENMTGIELLKMIFNLRNLTDWDNVTKYINYWEFDPTLKIKKMSKGMKQKLALCIAWMHNPDIIVLDEPTTGLDPLMQEKFVELIKISKAEGKAIILSSHIFSEVEKTCDYVSIIKKGEIVSTIDLKEIQYNDEKTYEIQFKQEIPKSILESNKWIISSIEGNKIILIVNNENLNELIQDISKCDLKFLKEYPLTLEQYFMKYYQNEINTNLSKTNKNFIKKPLLKNSNSKMLFEIINKSYRSMIIMWSFLTIISILLIIAIIVTLKLTNGFVPKPNFNPNIPPPPIELYVNGLVQKFIGQVVFGILSYVLMVIFVLMNATKLISIEVERGIIVNLLTTNLTRNSIILTKMLTFISLIFVSVFLQWLVTIIFLKIFGQLQFVDLRLLTIKALGLLLLLFFTASIAFTLSTFFNRNSYAIGISGAIVIVSWVFQVASSFESLEWMRFFSVNSLFNPNKIENIDQFSRYLYQYIFMIIGGSAIFFAAKFIFIKKDLHI